MFPTDKFIKNVERNPCLWNTKCGDFARRDLKENAWNEIGEIVFYDWANLSSEEKQKKVAEMKKKWNNVRDYYRRDNHPDNINSKRKKYVFTDLLEFLDPVYDIRGSECDMSNLKLPAAKDTEDDDYESIEECSPKKVLKPKAISNKRKIRNKKIPSNAWKKMQNINIIKQMPCSTVLANSTTEENPHLSFLKSFIPEMEEMSPFERLDFKAGMINLLRSVKFPPVEEEHNETVHATHLTVNDSKIRQPSDFLSIRLASSSAVSPSPSLAVSTELISPKTELFTEDFC